MKKNINVVMPSMPPYQEYIEEIKDLWDSRWLTHSGPKHEKLGDLLCDFLKVKNICLFANGHLALETAILALRLKGEIITTPFTFASTTQAIVRCGCTPIFCDICEDNLTIDVDKIEALITDKTVAILPVHVYGNVCAINSIESIAKKHNLKVIYDSAHAFGVEVDGKGIGSFGDISMFSFHSTKVFHTVEGGSLSFSDKNLNPLLKQLRQFGMNGQISVPEIGSNMKMTEMHAAMGLCNLRHIDGELVKRKNIFIRYAEHLKNVEGIKICNVFKENQKSNYAYIPILVEEELFGINRDKLAEVLLENGIVARKYFSPLTSSFEAYQDMFEIASTPVAEKIASKVLCLPMYADLQLEDVTRICDIIKKV